MIDIEYIAAKTILSGYANNGNWFGTNYNMNIYKGCCHGCIYCDSRSECYRVDDFDRVRAKADALRILRDNLRSKVKVGVVGTGAMSDPYNPFEAEYKLTRHALELINAYEFGIAIATKSPMIVRDIDILSDIKQHSPVLCKLTITTADDALCKQIERNVAPTSERLQAMAKLSEGGIFCGALMMPILPFINDTEENIKAVVRLVAEAGGRFIYPAFGVTLRQNQRDHYFGWLDKLFPGLSGRYVKQFGTQYSCTSPHALKLMAVFAEECQRYGILYKMQDIIRAYRQGYENGQMTLFPQ